MTTKQEALVLKCYNALESLCEETGISYEEYGDLLSIKICELVLRDCASYDKAHIICILRRYIIKNILNFDNPVEFYENRAYTVNFDKVWLRDDLKRALAAYPLQEREKRMLELVYWDGLPIIEAGKVCGFNRTIASRVHAKVLMKLRHPLRLKFYKDYVSL